MNEWIRIKDRLPPMEEELIFFNGKQEVSIGKSFQIEDKERVWIVDLIRVTNEIATHWMPLPKPPKDKNEMD